MINLEQDLQIAEGMALDLKNYLLSDTLYWSITSGGLLGRSLYKGTLGGMLMRLHQLDVLRDDLSTEQQLRLDEAHTHANYHIEKWVVQCEYKAIREVKARVRQWGIYVNELEESTQAFMDEYPTQARGRTALAFAINVAGSAMHGTSLFTRLILYDRKLAKVVRDSPFVLDDQLAGAYPKRPYWWLYATPLHPDEHPLRFGQTY